MTDDHPGSLGWQVSFQIKINGRHIVTFFFFYLLWRKEKNISIDIRGRTIHWCIRIFFADDSNYNTKEKYQDTSPISRIKNPQIFFLSMKKK